MSEYLILRHRAIPGLERLPVYLEHQGFAAFKKAVTELQPAQIIQMVKDSGLRGRGGAGFPTGLKWSFLPNDLWPHYVVANADESEPGTFKDREIMESNPFQFLEGLMIASYAVQARVAYIYIRGEYWHIAKWLDQKIAELEQAGLLGENLFGTDYSLRLYTHLGAGAYICGEETALLESLEGKIGQPRLRPPFPATAGLYNRPTVVNNVETLANVPLIVLHGPAWYHNYGTDKSPGTKVFSLSGCVNRPGNYELPFGVTFRELIFEHGGGVPEGRTLKAVMTAGASSVLIPMDESVLDTPMDYESLNKFGGSLGSASVIVLDDSVNMAWLTYKTVNFFKHESCGKCTPCREGTYWMNRLAERIARGQGEAREVELLYQVARQMQGKCLCALGEFSTLAVVSSIDRFRADYEAVVTKEPAYG